MTLLQIWLSQVYGFKSSRGSDGKKSACSAGDLDSIPGSRQSPGEGNGYPIAWRIPWAEEPDGLQSIRLQSVRYDWETDTLRFFNILRKHTLEKKEVLYFQYTGISVKNVKNLSNMEDKAEMKGNR